MKRAYRTTWNGITSIVAAESASQARRIAKASGSRSWHGPVLLWVDIETVRAPEHDDWAAVDSTGRCWDESYLPLKGA